MIWEKKWIFKDWEIKNGKELNENRPAVKLF